MPQSKALDTGGIMPFAGFAKTPPGQRLRLVQRHLAMRTRALSWPAGGMMGQPSQETGASRACGHCRYHAIYQAFPNHPSRACMRAALASIGRGSCGACRHWTQAHVRQMRLQCICAMQMAWLGRAAWQKGGAGNGGRCWQLRQGNPHASVLPARRPLSRMDGRRQVPMPAAAVPLSYFRPWLH